jgi:hypothetical protein
VVGQPGSLAPARSTSAGLHVAQFNRSIGKQSGATKRTTVVAESVHLKYAFEGNAVETMSVLREANLILLFDTGCHFLGQSRPKGEKAKTRNRQQGQGFSKHSPTHPNAEKVRL